MRDHHSSNHKNHVVMNDIDDDETVQTQTFWSNTYDANDDLITIVIESQKIVLDH